MLNDGYVMRTKGRVEGLARYDRNLVWLGSIGQNRVIRQPGRSRPPLRLNFPLWVGKRWSDSYRALDETLTGFHHFANLYVVEAVETIRISSQDILTFRIRRIRKSVASGESAEGHTWYAPAVRNVVRIQNNWPGGTNLILTGFKPSSNPPRQQGAENRNSVRLKFSPKTLHGPISPHDVNRKPPTSAPGSKLPRMDREE